MPDDNLKSAPHGSNPAYNVIVALAATRREINL